SSDLIFSSRRSGWQSARRAGTRCATHASRRAEGPGGTPGQPLAAAVAGAVPIKRRSTMSIDTKYCTTAIATGGRDGRAFIQDGALDLKLSTPRELGGPGQAGATNPEQLFAAGYAACFLSAVKLVAYQQRVQVPDDASVAATVAIGPRDEGGFGLAVDLAVG